MNGKRFLPLLASFAILTSACTQQNTGDEPPPSTAPQGLNRFLLFPNPVVMSAGGFETNTTAYATAYYAAIDPGNAKDTLAKWRTANGFGTGGDLRAVFRDAKDLGYGRNMNGRINMDGSIAFYVENYNVAPNASTGGYASALNVEAAINRDTRWHVGTNAIEWSSTPCIPGFDPPDCQGTVKFAKFYNFSSRDGTRQLAVDLDGNGAKSMPGPCISCHGGRGDPLTPTEGNPAKPRFPLVENSLSRKRGDVQARLHGMNVDSFGFSPDIPAFSKANQQAALKIFNQWILCTYPLPAASALPEDACRSPAGQNEWQGTAAEMIKQWYGGPSMPQPSFKDVDTAGQPLYVPTGWGGVPGAPPTPSTIPNTSPPLTDVQLYQEVVAPFCRTCHILRGTNNQSDIDFTSLTKFQGYADRIKKHVFDRGTMPLALIVYDDFWNSSAPATLANFIDATLAPGTATFMGNVLKPGRPVADPGPDRMVRTATSTTLSGENSLFAGSFAWSVTQGAATITGANSMVATFNAPSAGTYKVRLTVGNGSQTDSKVVTIVADDAFPASVKFAHVKNVMQNVSHTTTQQSGKCVDCHHEAALVQPSQTPPIWYTSFDRNGDAQTNDTDDAWFAKAVQGRVNLTDITASPLLRKPTGNHHNGQMLLDVTDTTNGGLRDYSILYSWILAGMPPGGLAASPQVNGGVNPGSFIFSGGFGGPFTSPAIAMDASQSVGPTGVPLSFTWSLVSQPAGGNAIISNPAIVNPTLTVQNVGDYVLQLQASGGGQSDIAQTRFTVTETPFAADFTPADQGSAGVDFSGGRGDISLQSNTSTFATGSPVSCSWTVLSGPGVSSPGVGVPGGPTLDGNGTTLTSTKACQQTAQVCFPFFGGTICFPVPVNAAATLNVPSSALNGQYVVQFTASTVTSQTLTHAFTVAENPPLPSISVTSATAVAFGQDGSGPRAFITLSGSSTGIPPFTFTWSIDPPVPGGGFANSSITSGAATSTLTARATGSHVVRLAVRDSTGATGSATATVTVTPSRGTTFATMTGLFSGQGCTGCHFGGGANPANNSGTPPDWTTTVGSDGSTLWGRVFQRVAPGNPGGSLLLLNPEDVTNATNPNGHGGGCRPDFGCGVGTGGNPDTGANATTFSNWILDGAPPGN